MLRTVPETYILTGTPAFTHFHMITVLRHIVSPSEARDDKLWRANNQAQGLSTNHVALKKRVIIIITYLLGCHSHPTEAIPTDFEPAFLLPAL
jgi:hypothetical protein